MTNEELNKLMLQLTPENQVKFINKLNELLREQEAEENSAK